jgi:hypothetical protein
VTYAHVGGTTCLDCDQTKVVERPSRSDSDPKIHYGSIGSGNAVFKDGATRERLRKDLGVLCVETRMNNLALVLSDQGKYEQAEDASPKTQAEPEGAGQHLKPT